MTQIISNFPKYSVRNFDWRHFTSYGKKLAVLESYGRMCVGAASEGFGVPRALEVATEFVGKHTGNMVDIDALKSF